MKTLLALFLAAAPAPAAPPALPGPVDGEAIRHAVVSVKITAQDYDWRAPWSKQPPQTRACTGLVVPGKHVILTSDCVANATLVELQKLGEERRYLAHVSLSDYEAALALVDADEPEFWTGLAPLPLDATLPTDGDVTLHRWLLSNQLETARGQARQVRVDDHGFGRTPLLTLDLNASMQGGGNSEVVLRQGRVVGLTSTKSDDMVAAVGSPVMQQFLQAASKTPYPGVARAGLQTQKLLNPHLRRALGMADGEGGVLINRVLPHSGSNGVLLPGDVLLAVAGLPVDVSGQVSHPAYGKLSYVVLFGMGHSPGETLEVKVLRNKERKTLQVPLRRMLVEQDRIPSYVLDQAPSYTMRGGLVFQDLTYAYLGTYGDWRRRANIRLVVAAELDAQDPSPEHPRLVVLTNVLPDTANLGYQDSRDLIVDRVNGVAVRTVADVRTALDGPPPDGRFHVVEFAPGQATRRMVLDAAEMKVAMPRIMERYGVGEAN